MEWEITVVDPHGGSTPVVAEAGEDATVADLRGALVAVAGRPIEPGAVRFRGGSLDDGVRLAGLGLIAGAELRLDGTASPPTDPRGRVDRAVGALELAVVGGLAGGARVVLPTAGAVTLGRSGDCDLSVDDPEVSRRHAEIQVGGAAGGGAAALTLTDAASRNGTAHHGFRTSGPTRIKLGDAFQIGETIIAARLVPPVHTQMSVDAEHSVVRYNRPPRILQPAPRPELTVPARPERPRGLRFPLAMVLIPLLAAGVLYMIMPGSTYYLIFLALAPLMAIAHYVTERRGGHRDYKEKMREYLAESARLRAQLDDVAAEDRTTSREALPDPATVVRTATLPTGRLFERRPGHPDFLRLRVGLADRPAKVRLSGPGADGVTPPTVHAVPVSIDLTEAGVVGVAGPRSAAMACVRALICQTAVLHAPHDLGVMLITGSDTAAEWEWLSWLPHTLPHRAEQDCRRLLATDLRQAEARIVELGHLLDERRAEQRQGLRESPPMGRRLILVVDGAQRLRGLAGLSDLLADGPSVGVYALCLDAAEPSLPDECRATVVFTGPSRSRVRVSRPDCKPEAGVLVDGLPVRLAHELACAIAPVRVLGARFGDDEGLPDSLSFLDLAGLGVALSAEDVMARWAAQPDGRTTRALLGVGPAGRPVEVDLRRDGPHALVAGTSGAGKSELLQTIVASLALGNAPDALNFVLVDYKGGSAFADCRDLPHTVGFVTDLDGHLASRALTSLSAELRRREAILAESGAKDIDDYWALTGGRLPRLVIVIDEFASLVEEIPDFVRGVVGIGMRGRSLGVHVVLATQRPAGVVNGELRANVNLRICLRVTSSTESSDVIDVGDAARISRHVPGRAHLRTGHSDLAVLQCARIGRPRAPGGAASAGPDLVVRRRRVTELGGPRRIGEVEPETAHNGETDLTVLVAAVQAAAERAGIAAPAGPWLPPLPDNVTADRLDLARLASPVAVPLGLADHPARQVQTTFVLDLEEAAPVAVAGMARSGRSTALRTIAAALAAHTSPADVHLYVLDYGGRALAPLAALPHCGAWVDPDEPDRAERLLALLTAETARRERFLGSRGYGSLREQRAAAGAAERPAYFVLLIDQYEAFLARHAEVDGGRLVEEFERLLRRGPTVGILPVLATDRSGFGHTLASTVGTRLILRQAENDQVTAFGLHPRDLPRTMPPGRAIAMPGAVEVQLALLDSDPDGTAQNAAVERLKAMLAPEWADLNPALRPHRVDPLPDSITSPELARLRTSEPPDAPTACTIGAGGDHLGPVDIDLAEAGSTLLISGPPRSGRSSALVTIACSLIGRLPLVAICPRPSPLRGLAGVTGVADVAWGAGLATDLEDALDAIDGPAAILVDDAELLTDDRTVILLEDLARAARDEGNVIIAAGTTDDLLTQRYRGWLPLVRRGRCGVLLNPVAQIDGEVFDVRLPRSTRGGHPPGRGLLVWRDAITPIQIPLSNIPVTSEEPSPGGAR